MNAVLKGVTSKIYLRSDHQITETLVSQIISSAEKVGEVRVSFTDRAGVILKFINEEIRN